jgi:hypothetical protein
MCSKKIASRILFLIFCSAIFTFAAQSQTTAFNFQGRLNDGSSAANGNYDLRFKLYDAIVGGTELGAIDRPNLQLINGVFSTALDFGSLAFQNVGDRFLEIAVRPAGSPNAYVVLGARQQLLSVPFAVRAINSTNATNATNAANATNAQNSLSLGGVLASNYAKLNTANSGELMTDGNIRQSASAFGVVKAMIYVYRTGTISRCYNGVTGASTGNCGFVVVHNNTGSGGVYNINFGFPVDNRFVSVTVDNSIHDPSSVLNWGANFRFNGTNLEVFTFEADDPDNTYYQSFMVIVY